MFKIRYFCILTDITDRYYCLSCSRHEYLNPIGLEQHKSHVTWDRSHESPM